MKKLIVIFAAITMLLTIVACAPTVQAPTAPTGTQSSSQTTPSTGETTEGTTPGSTVKPEKEKLETTAPSTPETTTPETQTPTEPPVTTHPNTEPPVTQQPHTHKYTSQTTQPTCSKEGKTVYICDCGYTYNESIPKVSHNYTSTRVEPKCDTYGKLIYTCTSCNYSYTENIAMTEHQYKLTDTVESTTTKKGYKQYTCSGCGKTYKDELPLKKGAIDTDKCGESLIWKPLKHAGYVSFMTKAFKCLEDRIVDSRDQSYCVEMPEDANFYTWFTDTYRYIAEPFYYTFYRYDDKPDLFLMWGKDASVYTEQDAVYAEAKRVIKQLGITSSTTQREAITKINNYICKQKYYQYDSSKRDGSTYHSVFGDNGVCHNYAVAFQVLCLTAGIECHYYSSSTMNHAWNKVYFSDGSYYWVDVTWNDSDTPNRYLLITTEQLLKDHTL